MGGMIDRAAREMRDGQTKFSVWDDPGTVPDLRYVNDQLDAILAADVAFENDILNCSANRPLTIGDAAESLREALGWEPAPR